MPLKHKWKRDSAEKFIEAQNKPVFDQRLENILLGTFEKSDIGCRSLNKEIIDDLTALADGVIPKIKGLPNRFKKRWFDKECLASRRSLARLAKKIPKHRHVEELQKQYYGNKKAYTKLIKRKKLKHMYNLNQKIESGKVFNWNAFKHVKNETNNNSNVLDNFDLYNFYLFFKNLYGNSIPQGTVVRNGG